ncbi:MAG: hypothetical protein ACI936_002071 [Paraglaciecola sp.]|jgi:hypothetical protein
MFITVGVIIAHLTVVANGNAIDWSQPGEVLAPVAVNDIQNKLVFSTQVRININIKK